MPNYSQIKKILARFPEGDFALKPQLVNYMQQLDQYVVDQAQQDHQSKAYQFPELIPVSFFKKINYFDGFPRNLWFAFHLGPNASDEEISQIGGSKPAHDCCHPEGEVLQSAVCYNFYRLFADQEIQADERYYTAVGSCFRHEAKQIRLIERLSNFTMREVVFFGSPEETNQFRGWGIELTKKLMDKLELNGAIKKANDPFFISSPNVSVKNYRDPLKWEMRLNIDQGKDLACVSYNHHGNFFTDQCNISIAGVNEPTTGCVAFGWERWLWALICQHGTEVEEWPKI